MKKQRKSNIRLQTVLFRGTHNGVKTYPRRLEISLKLLVLIL